MSHFSDNIALHIDVATNITLSHSSKKCKRFLSSVGLTKTFMGYFVLGAPTSERSVLTL